MSEAERQVGPRRGSSEPAHLGFPLGTTPAAVRPWTKLKGTAFLSKRLS